MTKSKRTWWQKLIRWTAILLLLALPVAFYAWIKFFREEPQAAWITDDPIQNFLYGSIGGEEEAGLPYWLMVVLPRLFPEYLPGPGGYASLGLPWEEGKEFPVGFSKKTIGFERVGFNCSLCHATQYRIDATDTPTIVAAGGSHTADIQGLLDFFTLAANDPRFNSDVLLQGIDIAYPLSFDDRLIYKYLLIPITRKRLIEQGDDFAWAADRPAWGPGRDAPMNLTKFNFLGMEIDDTVDNTDFPSLWNMHVREPAGSEPGAKKLNLDGATPVLRSVIIDSAMGIGGRPSDFFHRRVDELDAWLKTLPAPDWPEELPYDAELAALGAPLFAEHCAECHATGDDISGPEGARLGHVIPTDEVGTDAERVDTWTQAAADGANDKVCDEFGICPPRRPLMEKHDGYVAIPLDGLWLKAPYLHNGSVPTVRALLDPPAERPTAFYRGYDVLDPVGFGFVTDRCPIADETSVAYDGACAANVAAEGDPCIPAFADADGALVIHDGWCMDTTVRGNGNGGHLWGTELADEEKDALVEFLKAF